MAMLVSRMAISTTMAIEVSLFVLMKSSDFNMQMGNLSFYNGVCPLLF